MSDEHFRAIGPLIVMFLEVSGEKNTDPDHTPLLRVFRRLSFTQNRNGATLRVN